ncbi:MAG: HAD hydrolase-like protein [Eubacteriaceae bacterium]|nr:HAD hydrolase-like protein [Eubacteriaceae bacterium]
MGRYKCVIFDLDGTVADTKKGIINGYKYAAKEMGFKYLKAYDNDIIGPSLYDSFTRFYKFSDDKAKEAVELYRIYYKDKGFLEYDLYDGIKNLIFNLKHNGISIALATTKYKDFAELMLRNSGIYEYFTCVAGSNADGSLSGKKELLEYVMANTKYLPSDCVMVGDRFYDAAGANEVGMDFIRAGYGYGKDEEFDCLKVDYTVVTANDILKIVIN